MQPAKKPFKDVGVDVGLYSYAMLSDGSFIENPRYFRKEEKKLARLQRQHSRKRKGSQNREKCRVKVAKLHEKIENRRNDFLHKASRKIANTYETMYVEDLRISNMVFNHCLAKSISDASWGRFAGMIAYKAEGVGGRLIKVNPRNTSQLCSQCDEIVKKPLSTRLHECPSCGLVMDRDLNGALNVLKRGREIGREPPELTPEGEFATTQLLEVVQANSMNQEASLLVGR
jgi:putative transposase